MQGSELDKKNEGLIDYLEGHGYLKTAKVTEAFRHVPRHMFVTDKYKPYSYEDIPLPTLKDSTISQPSTVALMLEALEPNAGEKILEVGTGSGYVACLLAKCVGSSGKIITIEIDKDLTVFATKNVSKFDFKNIEVLHRDGSAGYPKEAPFDKIIYSVAVPEIPNTIMKQLRVGGRVLAPVSYDIGQILTSIDKISNTKFDKKDLGYFMFVPLKGRYGFKETKDLF